MLFVRINLRTGNCLNPYPTKQIYYLKHNELVHVFTKNVTFRGALETIYLLEVPKSDTKCTKNIYNLVKSKLDFL